MRAALLKIVETLEVGEAQRLLTSVDILQRVTPPPTGAVADARGHLSAGP